MTPAEELAMLRRLAELEAKAGTPAAAPAPDRGIVSNVLQGGLSGAARIGSTLLWPMDAAADFVTGNDGESRHSQRKASLEQFFDENANPDSLAFRGGDLATSIAGTAGMGGVLAKGATMVPALARFAPALSSGGFSVGNAATTGAANAATRLGAGAAVGGTSAAYMDPETAGTGALLGAALPGGVALGGKLGSSLGLEISPAVQALYQKAQQLGIPITADRLTNSPALNALAASLRYIPFSGRQGAEDAMLTGLNRAASNTMGQDTSNMAAALRNAKRSLGQQFDNTLSSNSVTVDQQLLDDLTQASQRAGAELVPTQAAIIDNQINGILGMAGQGSQIEGQAFYNLKKTLDRVGNRATPEAFYAQDLRNKLIDALNRSLGPDEAAAFAKVREQYGNMKTLEKLAPNGAEGEITAGRLGGIRGARSQDLQDVADISAQFVKTRENPHGAAQRVFMSALGIGAPAAAGTAGLLVPALAATGVMGAGRVANEALRSRALAELLMNPQGLTNVLQNPLSRTLPMAISASQGIQQ
jgi:hypothetical protein